MAHDKPIPNTADLVIEIGGALNEALCDHQAFFLVILDEHVGAMPCAEDLTHRSSGERKRAADVLRMWAARIESGNVPKAAKS
jgi:hypothetical protein